MIKVFVSQPMRGVPEGEIEARREEILALAADYLGQPVTEIPKADPAQLEGRHPAYSLGHSIQMMSDADLAVFADGWSSARGCLIEHEVCLQYGISCAHEFEIRESLEKA